MLELVNLSQSYFYGPESFKDINLTVQDGEKIAILAKSGGGKTSLLKCIAGLYPATKGQILLNGVDITKAKIKNRDIRFIYDDGGLIRKRNVKFNLEYPLKLRKIERTERKIVAYNVAKEYGLEPFYKETTFRLFEQEIIALALARLELRPCSLTLIDDVFSLLNGYEREYAFKKYLSKLRGLKETVIFATSSLYEAFSFADRVLVLNGGFLQQVGAPTELIENPQTLAVDEMVNPFKARLICGAVGKLLELDDVKMELPNDYDNDEVIISYSLKEDVNGVDFRVDRREYLSNGSFAYYNVANECFLYSAEGELPKVSIDKESIRLFDRVTEKRLTFKFI